HPASPATGRAPVRAVHDPGGRGVSSRAAARAALRSHRRSSRPTGRPRARTPRVPPRTKARRGGQARPRVAGPAVMLAAEPSAHFRRHGWVHLPGFFGPSETASLLAWTDEITGWPETPGAWMRYYEKAPDGGRMLARIENFVPYHEELATLLT